MENQVTKLKQRFDISRVVLVGDRGMITSARLEQTVRPAGLDWITALRAPQIRALVEEGTLQLSLFDERDLTVHSFQSLLRDLGTITRNLMSLEAKPDATFVWYPKLTPVQERAFQLLEVAVRL